MRQYQIGEPMSDEDSLAHYGVKGMKWGVRNAALKTMDRTGFTKAAQKNAANAKKRTAVGVAIGSTVGGGNRARRKAEGTPRITRKQNRQMNKEASQQFYAKKAETIYRDAKKNGDKVLISTLFLGDNVKTVTTGKEIAAHLERGGLLNVKATEVFARRDDKAKQYVLNDQFIGNYKKQDFRKTS